MTMRDTGKKKICLRRGKSASKRREALHLPSGASGDPPDAFSRHWPCNSRCLGCWPGSSTSIPSCRSISRLRAGFNRSSSLAAHHDARHQLSREFPAAGSLAPDGWRVLGAGRSVGGGLHGRALGRQSAALSFLWFRGVEKDLRYTTLRKRVYKDEESTTNLHSRV
jgi:hypothetical protein